MPRDLRPETFEAAAAALAQAGHDGHSVRIRGGGTKLGWGGVACAPELELHTTALSEIVEHNVGDLTAILQAGVALERAQEAFAAHGQMLALDPPLGRGSDRQATIGGMIATGDSGPLRHRYGAPRELVVGMTVALGDGTIASSGGKVIKNVAGYDLGKLFAGSFGTLGAILSVSVRLHPLPTAGATTLGSSADADVLATAARTLAGAPLELEALDVAWRAGRGGILARAGGPQATRRSERVAALMRSEGLEHVDIATDDDELWARQRAGQRSRSRALLRIAARPSTLAVLLRCAQSCGGTLVGRAALGSCFVELDPDPEAVGRLRASLPSGAASILVDAPAELRAGVDSWGGWGASKGPALELCRRVKARFDPRATCNPGVFVGGI
ncbi:MAG: FAD-binding oxidoreductase [Solirubrobacteraceae bacterium]